MRLCAYTIPWLPARQWINCRSPPDTQWMKTVASDVYSKNAATWRAINYGGDSVIHVSLVWSLFVRLWFSILVPRVFYAIFTNACDYLLWLRNFRIDWIFFLEKSLAISKTFRRSLQWQIAHCNNKRLPKVNITGWVAIHGLPNALILNSLLQTSLNAFDDEMGARLLPNRLSILTACRALRSVGRQHFPGSHLQKKRDCRVVVSTHPPIHPCRLTHSLAR